MPRAVPRSPKKSTHSPGQRQLRVGEEIRHVLARILAGGALRDPALQELRITVAEVRVTPDLKHATAFVMPLGGRDAVAALAGLRRGAAYLRTQVAREVKLRIAPTVAFELDASFDQASRIDALLRRPDVARDLTPQKSDDGA